MAMELDRPKEACGLFGITAPGVDVAREAFFALYALQHRGQESAGIATHDGQTAYVHRGMGLVTQVFNEDNLAPLKGNWAIGHTRYSTTGASQLRNAQPHVIETLHGPLAIAHNGNLTNAAKLRKAALSKGIGLRTGSDSEVIAHMLAQPLAAEPEGGEADWMGRLQRFMGQCPGAYALVVMTREGIYGVRDPLGLRPLCIGSLNDETGKIIGYALASESCALSTIGARFVRSVQPGEVVRLSPDGRLSSVSSGIRAGDGAFCIFEYVYFARPDSQLEGQTVHHVRQKLGEMLAREAPVPDADIVIGVPDSSIPAAIGYARASGLRYTEGLIKNRYIGRTFIQPDDRLRKSGVQLKLNPLPGNLAGKRVVMIDDSIVRGNTMGPIVQLLRDAGAREVHVRISSPPVKHPCFMGIDMATHEQLIAHRLTPEQIAEHMGADSLHYLSLEGMTQAVRGHLAQPEGHCRACFSGEYPLEIIPEDADPKLNFERIQGE